MCLNGQINSIIVIIYLRSLIQYPLSTLSLLFFICSISITSEQYTCRHVGFDRIRLPCDLLEICLQLTARFLNNILKCELQKEPHIEITQDIINFFSWPKSSWATERESSLRQFYVETDCIKRTSYNKTPEKFYFVIKRVLRKR